MTNNLVETLLYKNEESAVSINVVIDQENETMWATQKTIAELFNVNVPAISKHLKNIFNEGELTKNSVISKMETTANDGKKYNTNFYNLDAIISVGYRVNSKEATQFCKWATKILREYMVKGFALDTELLKNGSRFGKDYFDELLEKIKEIRASERRVYQKITDIFKECSWDYDKDSETAREFYSKVQNKLHYAILVKLQQRLSMKEQTILKNIWD
ncbi:MAG: virulence RhuM family protein [Methanobrevibacter woesei]|nr:virulence RhuM family protein [Methanobrevibacter woesei]